MKIIDRYGDYYDYLSFDNRFKDDSIVLDRRKSIILSKKDLCGEYDFYKKDSYEKYLYLHIGYVSWIIRIEFITDYDKNNTSIVDNSIKLSFVESWKDYEDKYLFGFGYVDIPNYTINYVLHHKNKKTIKEVIEYEKEEYKRYGHYDKEFIIPFNTNSNIKNSDIYILRESGIPSIISAEDIYNAFDEYLSSLKNDKNVEINLTDEQRIENHGFDKRTSFRRM